MSSRYCRVEGSDANCFILVAAFLKDPREEFNMHIDAPVELEAELFSIHSR
jgi:hypothetical protein